MKKQKRKERSEEMEHTFFVISSAAEAAAFWIPEITENADVPQFPQPPQPPEEASSVCDKSGSNEGGGCADGKGSPIPFTKLQAPAYWSRKFDPLMHKFATVNAVHVNPQAYGQSQNPKQNAENLKFQEKAARIKTLDDCRKFDRKHAIWEKAQRRKKMQSIGKQKLKCPAEKRQKTSRPTKKGDKRVPIFAFQNLNYSKKPSLRDRSFNFEVETLRYTGRKP